jgi:hypothetical protein
LLVRRHILGFSALACFAWAAILGCCPALVSYQAAGAMGLRFGLVLGAFWLAWPELHRLPRWLWYVLPIGLLLLLYARGILVFLLPGLGVAATLYFLYRRLRRSSR